MFTQEISGLTLTNQVADSLFQNISGFRYKNDDSFLATLRALMYRRVPKEESINHLVTRSSFSGDSIRSASARDCVRAFLDGTGIRSGAGGVLNIHSFVHDDEGSRNAAFNVLDAGIEDLLGGYTTCPDVDKWLEQNGKVRARVYLNENKKNTLVFVEQLDMKRWHLLQSLIPRYFPWYFKDAPLDDEETALIKSLTKRYAPEYKERIEEFAKRFDFRTLSLRKALSGFEVEFERCQLDEVRHDIHAKNDQIEALHEKFSRYYQELANLTTQELGLIEKINRGETDGDSELLEYFLCNKSLNLVSADRGTIEFVVTTTISNFDPDVFDSAINKGESFFYRHYANRDPYGNPELTDERIKRLMLAIFRDETLKLRVCAAYRLGFANGDYRGLSGYPYPKEILQSHTPNQHIDYYACLGNNARQIREAMVKRDYVAAISACCASASNINLTEPNTGTYFMKKICAKDVGKIIQMPDGSTMTPVDAVKWLEEREAAKENNVEGDTNEQTD